MKKLLGLLFFLFSVTAFAQYPIKTIVNSTTGEVMYAADEYDLKANETAVPELCTIPYDPETQRQVFNFTTRTFTVEAKPPQVDAKLNLSANVSLKK